MATFTLVRRTREVALPKLGGNCRPLRGPLAPGVGGGAQEAAAGWGSLGSPRSTHSFRNTDLRLQELGCVLNPDGLKRRKLLEPPFHLTACADNPVGHRPLAGVVLRWWCAPGFPGVFAKMGAGPQPECLTQCLWYAPPNLHV